MAMIYGPNYLGSSLVGPTWACAPGMQTLAACRAICAPWKGGGWGGGVQRGRRQPRWRRYESQPVGDGREGDRPDRPVELGLG